ncbi:MAG: hypothetical protein F6K28_48630 [Microcoleus sp. SIO2G3]|nr:hypothetical protein [Microcoleus sp. SIO2G3]
MPERLWVQGAHDYRGNWNLFEITPDLVLGDRIRSHSGGIDWNHLPTEFTIGLEPVAIAFADYLYWVPESKFEFVKGKPWIGCEPGVRGLAGMLLMSLGLLDALRLFHPQQWVAALLNTRTQRITDAKRKAQWREVAQRAAALLRAEYGATRLAIAGDVIADRPLNFWSQLYLAAWDLQLDMEASYQMYQALQALSSDLEIVILAADDLRFPPSQQMIDAGVVEI